jgi:hypothetical protein
MPWHAYTQMLLCAKALGQALRAKALTEFDEQTVIQRTIAVYRALCPWQFASAHGRFMGKINWLSLRNL